jgi:hypothetical protein
MKRFTALMTFFSLVIGLMPAVAFADGLSFDDLDSTNKDFIAIEYLKVMDVVEGEDGSFSPDRSMNRAEFVKVIVEAALPTPSVDEFSDCFPDVTDEWFAPYVCLAKDRGWIEGYPDGYFHPEYEINMVETIKISLESAMDVEEMEIGDTHFVDLESGAWYEDYVALAEELNLLEEEGAYLDPSKIMTRSNVSQQLFRSMAMRQATETSFNQTAYDVAISDADLYEIISEKELIVANSYSVESDGSVMIDDYYTDIDGVFDIDSYSSNAALVVADSYLETDEGIEVSEYSLDSDGLVVLNEYEDRDDEWVVIFVANMNTESEDEWTVDDIEFEEIDLDEIQIEEDPETDEVIEEEPEEEEEEEDPIPDSNETYSADDPTHCAFYEDPIANVTCEEQDYYGWVTFEYIYNKYYSDVEFYGDEPEYKTLDVDAEENTVFVLGLRRVRVYYQGELGTDIFYIKDMQTLGEYVYEYNFVVEYKGETTTSSYEYKGPASLSLDTAGFDSMLIGGHVNVDSGAYSLSHHLIQADNGCVDTNSYVEYNGEVTNESDEFCFTSGFAIEGTSYSIDSVLSGSEYTAPDDDVTKGVYTKNWEWNIVPTSSELDGPYLQTSGDDTFTEDEWDGWTEAALYDMKNY